MHEYLKFINDSSGKVSRILDSMSMTLNGFGETLAELLGEKESLTDEELKLFTDTAKSAEKNILNTVLPPSGDDIKNIYIKSFT